MRDAKGKIFAILLLALLMSGRFDSSLAQTDVTRAPRQVFLQRDVDEGGIDRLVFIDALTSEETSVEVSGERYTLAGDKVLYFDPATTQVMLVAPDGMVESHPFIQLGLDARRVDWLVAPAVGLIAWTLTGGTPESLATVTTVANLDGTNPRRVLEDGPRSSIRVLPVAFNADHTLLYMDFQPDGVADFTPFPQYAGLFSLDLATGERIYLPDEPGCFCGAGFGGHLFLRLKVAADFSGFDLRVMNLTDAFEQTLPALQLSDFTQAGDIVISPDGEQAVYAVAQIRDFGTANQSARTVFVLVDLAAMTQTPLTEPITTFVEPLAWTEDNSAIIFTSRQRDGTWKISLSDGRLQKVADATYLGVLRQS